MKNSVLALLFFLSFGVTVLAQENKYMIEEGDMLVLGEVPGQNYRYIDFPKKNIILKRGAIANFSSLVGTRLVVQKLETNKDGTLQAVLRRRDGKNFFRFFPKVNANVEMAILSGELKTINYKSKEAIANK